MWKMSSWDNIIMCGWKLDFQHYHYCPHWRFAKSIAINSADDFFQEEFYFQGFMCLLSKTLDSFISIHWLQKVNDHKENFYN